MNTMNRRIEIINILIIRRHTTANELAQELGVSIRTIQYDIQALSPQYPIYTKPGENGGLFIREDYNPHINSLTPMELENLREMYEQTGECLCAFWADKSDLILSKMQASACECTLTIS